MANVTISHLLVLYDITSTAANHGETLSLDEAKDAMADARTTDLVEQFDTMDKLELFDDEIIAKMNDLISHKHVYDAHRLGVEDNGLRLIAANVIQIIDNNTFTNPDTGEEVEPSSLEVIQDWR